MHRKDFLRNSSLVIGGMAFANQSLLARAYQETTPYKMKMLRNDIGIFTEKGGTIAYMLGKNGIVVVDSEFPEQANHLVAALKKQSDNPFQLLMNTHHHQDHTAGNIVFKGMVKNVVAHSNSKINQQAVAVKQKNEDQQLYPDITFDDTWQKSMGKESIKTHYFGPGHTNGDAIIHFEHANIAHMGDLVFNRRHPYIDRTAGANIKNWIVALDKTLSTFDDNTIFICGHAFDPEKIVINKDDIKAYQDYLQKLYAFAAAQVKAGTSKDDFIKNKAIPGVTEWQGEGIERPLTAAYEELSLG